MCRTARSSYSSAGWWLPATLVLALVASTCLAADDPQTQGKENKDKGTDAAASPADAAIRASADLFMKAFDGGDAKAVAELWTSNGTMADDRGEIYKGRSAIEQQYAEFFKAYPGAKMQVTITSIDFPTSTMAVEDGTAQVTVPGQAAPPVASRYTAVHVKEDGKWRMATVRETAIPLPSNYGRLEDLSWLIGTWETRTIRPPCEPLSVGLPTGASWNEITR